VAFFRPVKNPESPRSYLPKLAEPPAPEEKEEKIVPRYVGVPALREHGFGPRNLFWGVATILLALGLLAVALFLAGPKVMLSLATALLTFTALFVLARLHVFRQRNGGFFALAIVCLLGAAVPLLESGFFALKNTAGSRAAAKTEAASSAPEGQPLLLTQAFALTKPEGDGKQVRVLKDSNVVIGERPFLIKTGDVFSWIETKGDEATFAVRDLRLSLPLSAVEVTDPNAVAKGVAGGRAEPEIATKAPAAPPQPELTAEDLAAITASAQNEAIRRYPALGIRDSFENAAFISTYQQLKQGGSPDFFANPEWPIELAELLAKREGWNRGGPPMTTGPAPVLDAPDAPGEVLNEPLGGAADEPPLERGVR
jgi:hypothetical protein